MQCLSPHGFHGSNSAAPYRFARKKQTNTCRFQIPERSHCHQLHATGSNNNSFFRQLPLCCTEEQACSTCMSFRFFAVFVLFRETRRLWENWLIAKAAFPSPPTIVSSDGSCSCPESALGSRIGRTSRCMSGRWTTFKKHSHSLFLLNEIRDPREERKKSHSMEELASSSTTQSTNPNRCTSLDFDGRQQGKQPGSCHARPKNQRVCAARPNNGSLCILHPSLSWKQHCTRNSCLAFVVILLIQFGNANRYR